MCAFQPRPVSPVQEPKVVLLPCKMSEEKKVINKPRVSAAAVLAKRINKPPVAKPVIYSPEEVQQMDDYKLCREFIRVTGLTTLSCKHCGRDADNQEKGQEKNIYSHFMNAIRRRAEKKGLHRDMKLPKTCDKVLKRNDVCNPINNPAYYVIRHVSSDSSDIVNAINMRQEGLQAIGIATRPYRYD